MSKSWTLLLCAALLMGCDDKPAPDAGANGSGPSKTAGACPSWSGTLGGKKISGNDVHLTPAPMSGIALRAFKNGDAVDAPMLMGNKQGEEGGKIVLMANGTLAGHPVTSIMGTKVLWDKKAATITGTLKDSKTQKDMPVSITYRNASSDPPPDHCHK